MKTKTFRDLEHDGWLERAASYEFITPVTRQAIDPMLATFGDLNGQRLLEVACGPGHLAAHAAQQGADMVGVDFAHTMIDLARSNYPSGQFQEGDAEHLDFPDNSFDGVVCAFGLLHLADPDQAIREAYRVLKPGGRYTYSVWCPPEEGGEFFGFLMGAMQAHGDMSVALPPSPPFYRFADPDETDSAMTAAGFTSHQRQTVPVYWRGEVASDAVDVIYKATVRTKAILDAQTPSARDNIHAAIISGVEQFRVGDKFEIALPAVVVSGTKPA